MVGTERAARHRPFFRMNRRARIALMTSMGVTMRGTPLTFVLVAERGSAQADLGSVFGTLDKDPVGSLDGVR